MITDSHGATQVRRDRNHAIWLSNDNHDDSNYLALFNLADETQSISVRLDKLLPVVKQHRI